MWTAHLVNKYRPARWFGLVRRPVLISLVGLIGLAGLVGLSSSAGPIGSPLLAFALLQLQLKFADAPFEFVDAPYLLVDHQVAHVYLFIFSGVEHNGAGFGLHTVRAAGRLGSLVSRRIRHPRI